MVPNWIFQRQITLPKNKAYGFLYHFEYGLICEANAKIDKSKVLPIPNEEGFCFIGSFAGLDLRHKIGLVQEAIQALSDHTFLQTFGYEHHPSLNLLGPQIMSKAVALRSGN